MKLAQVFSFGGNNLERKGQIEKPRETKEQQILTFLPSSNKHLFSDFVTFYTKHWKKLLKASFLDEANIFH